MLQCKGQSRLCPIRWIPCTNYDSCDDRPFLQRLWKLETRWDFHQTSKRGYGSPFWIHARWRNKADGGTTKWSTIFNYKFLTGWVVGWPSVLQQMGPVQSYLLCWGIVGIWSAVGQVLGPHAGSVLWRETENDKHTTWIIIKYFFTIKVTSHSLYSTCTWK